MPVTYNPFCLSSYLTFRYVVDESQEWRDGVKTSLPKVSTHDYILVHTPDEIEEHLRNLIPTGNDIGILLSGGIDSAILASLMPTGTKAYTIDFEAPSTFRESQVSCRYASFLGLDLHIVSVCKNDYLRVIDDLMWHKKAPLHPVEAALFIAAKQAKNDGINTLVIGNGADSTFGGMDKLLSQDWTFNEFVTRYTFCEPAGILKNTFNMRFVYEKYRKNKNKIDYISFLKSVHGLGIIQSFYSSLNFAGIESCAPYENLHLGVPLDIVRIRDGEPKYMLVDIFKSRFEQFDVPAKIPFARPMDIWFQDWAGPIRDEFIADLTISNFPGEKKWLLYCLERFMNLCDEKLG